MKTSTAIALSSPYLLILVGSVFVSPTLAATLGTGKYDIKVKTSLGNYQNLGTITEFVTTYTDTDTDDPFAKFYNYANYKYCGEDVGFQSDHSHLFMVRFIETDELGQETGTNELGLFSVNGSPNNKHSSLIQMDYKLTGGTLEIRVADDNIPGSYPEVYTNPDDPLHWIHGFYGWNKNQTDGTALIIDDQGSNDNNGDQPWEITIDYLNLFTERNSLPDFQSLYAALFLSADSTQNITFDQSDGFQNGSSFIITPSDDTDITENIPEPSNMKGLILLGFLGGGWIFLKRKG